MHIDYCTPLTRHMHLSLSLSLARSLARLLSLSHPHSFVIRNMKVGERHGALLVLCRSLLLLMFLPPLFCAVSPTAYVQWMETQVKLIADAVSRNDQNSCALLETCSSSGVNCSREICTPLLEDYNSGTCISVPKNDECSAKKGSCNQMGVSTTKSYIRFPLDIHTYEIPYMRKTVCAQRMLDPIFKQIWIETQYPKAWIYFGSADGVHRSFPGREFNGSNCTSYDPRKRPWYIGSTFVEKDIVVLLDSGSSMSNFVSINEMDTSMSIAQNIVTNLLDTLSTSDHVSILQFNSLNATLVGNMSNTYIASSKQMISDLKDRVKKIKISSPQIPSNLTSGMDFAMGQFLEGSKLKIIMVLTNGNVELNDTSIIQQLRQENVFLFIYILGTDAVHEYGDLAGLVSSVNASIVNIATTDFPVENPLWAIRSYFDVMAQLRFAAIGRTPYWVHVYEDQSNLGNMTTVAFPVFDAAGHLLGVAAIDSLVDQFIAGTTAVIDEKPGLTPSRVLNPSPSYQGNLNNFQECNITTHTEYGVCNNSDSTHYYLDLLCCGQCFPQSLDSTDFPWKIVIAIAASALVVGIIVAIFVFCIYRRKVGKIDQGGSNAKNKNKIGPHVEESEEWSVVL